MAIAKILIMTLPMLNIKRNEPIGADPMDIAPIFTYMPKGTKFVGVKQNLHEVGIMQWEFYFSNPIFKEGGIIEAKYLHNLGFHEKDDSIIEFTQFEGLDFSKALRDPWKEESIKK